MSEAKISLPKFLKMFSGGGVKQAMEVAGKIYKDYNTLAKLSQLDELKLLAAGVEEKESRKFILDVLRKAGVIQSAGTASASTTISAAVQAATTPIKKKRKQPSTSASNEFLPDGPTDEASQYGSLEFNEVMDEKVLITKSTVVNRAPVMSAWSMIVAERLGFQREEALSIASVYTEMNAISKGVSLGLQKKSQAKDLEASRGGSQPYVELMGRRPLYQTQSNQWRALSGANAVQPGSAFSYISRSFRQTTPHIIGALRLLANSFTPQELNVKAWSLYADFRPAGDGWGQRSEVRCDTILGLRKPDSGPKPEGGETLESLVQYQDSDEPAYKKAKSSSLEEYEDELDQWDTVDLSELP
ncbi:hypothetical protein C8J56DRAFT_783011 [Mycena floridula]|nr:hypothetical protein C8J56DRAFT_783011 [Mycena floridula]